MLEIFWNYLIFLYSLSLYTFLKNAFVIFPFSNSATNVLISNLKKTRTQSLFCEKCNTFRNTIWFLKFKEMFYKRVKACIAKERAKRKKFELEMYVQLIRSMKIN